MHAATTRRMATLNRVVIRAGPCMPSARLSRSIHGSAASLASRTRRTQRTSASGRAAPAARVASEDGAVSRKIQVLPFDMTPQQAHIRAQRNTVETLTPARNTFGLPEKLWNSYQWIRYGLKLPTKVVMPDVQRWQAMYLPVWRLDHIVSFKQRLAGVEIDIEATSLGTYVPATQMEPLASAPIIVTGQMHPFDETDLEDYNPQKHLRAFQREDLYFPDESTKKPLTFPFSFVLPNIEDMYRKAAKNYQHDMIEFTGDFKTILQTASPVLLPYYLFEVEDANAYYSNVPVTTCLIFGRNFPDPVKMGPNVYREGIWLNGKPMLSNVCFSVLQHPKADEETGEIAILGESAHKAGFRAATKFVSGIREKLPHDAIKLDSNMELPDFSKKVDSIDSIFKYSDCTQANHTYATVRVKARVIEQQKNLVQVHENVPKEVIDPLRKALDTAKKIVRETAPPWVRP